ncbi:MAG: TraB/GumN family protein [Methanosarcinaceae archaeon]|nr:TraB/GumN family protein [Methanosarcinaceae archaeon]
MQNDSDDNTDIENKNENICENECNKDIEISDVIVSDLNESGQKMDMNIFFRKRFIPHEKIKTVAKEEEETETVEAETEKTETVETETEKTETVEAETEETETEETETEETGKKPFVPTQVYIIGTAHVSEKSVEEVKDAIETERPDVVAIELCPSRYKGLTEPQQPDKEISVKDMLAGGGVFYNLLYMLLANIQKKMGDEMGVPPGSEMIAAIDEAKRIGASVVLIDRDVKTTFQRFIAKMSLWEKIKLLYMLIGGTLGFGPGVDEEIDIDNLTQDDVITTLLEEFREYAPTVASVLIDERDAYLAGSIYETVRFIGPGKKVVVVIGAGHKEGVMKFLAEPKKIPQLSDLTVVPKKRISYGKIFAVLITLIIFLIFGYILYSVLTQPGITIFTFFEALAWWVLINGILSAAGAILAGGHYTSVVAAFAVSWMTSLNPFLAAGWIAGLVEARVRKPKVKDIKALINADTFKEMRQNNLFKVLLVAALTNVGSTIGTFLGGYIVFKISGIDIAKLISDAFSALAGTLF